VRVPAQATQGLRLTLNALVAERVQPLGLDHRERHVAVEARVVGEVDLFAPAFAQEARDLIAPSDEGIGQDPLGYLMSAVRPGVRIEACGARTGASRASDSLRHAEQRQGVGVLGVSEEDAVDCRPYLEPIAEICCGFGLVKKPIDAPLDAFAGHDSGRIAQAVRLAR
jgi:hypothetical protein